MTLVRTLCSSRAALHACPATRASAAVHGDGLAVLPSCNFVVLLAVYCLFPLFMSFTDIVEIKHIMLPPSPRDFKDIYVVFELMETDLHQVRAQAVNSSATGQLRSSVSAPGPLSRCSMSTQISTVPNVLATAALPGCSCSRALSTGL